MLHDYLIPWLTTNAISLALIGICYKWPRIGSYFWSGIFLLAGFYNGLSAIRWPELYQVYGETAIPYYRDFITGFFAEHAATFVLFIALGQVLISIGLFTRNRLLYKTAIAGALIFLLAITPLGWGAAFPATLLMVVSLIFLYLNSVKKHKLTLE